MPPPPDPLVLLDTVPIPVACFDRDGRHTYVNAARCRSSGHTPDQILGRTTLELNLPADLAAELHANVIRVAATGRPFSHTVGIPTPTGAVVLQVDLTPLPGGDGVVVAATDVTARADAERKLRESEELYRLLVEGVTDYAILLLDEAGRVASWNTGAERIKGYTAGEILGRHVSVFYPPEDAAAGRPAGLLARAAADGRAEDEGWRVRKDGSRFWGSVVVTALRDADGRLRGYAKVTRDETARKQAEEALRENEARVRQVFEDQTEMVSRFRPDGTLTFANDVYARLFGVPAVEAVGLRWQPHVHPDDVPQVEARLKEMSPANPVVVIENRVFDAAGRVRWMEFVNRGFYGPGGELVELQAVGRDVTARRAAEVARRELEADLRVKEQQRKYERQLLQAQKLESLGVLAGGIAHDFNNLLTAILGYASLGRVRLADGDPLGDDLRRIEEAALRAAELCQQMLAYAGRGQFVIRPVDLNALTMEMAQLLAAVVSKNAVLKFNQTAGLPAVEADPIQVRQVVMNLITNASDAIGAKSGVITVTTGLIDADARYLAEIQAAEELTPGRYVYLEVSDTGTGMSDDVRAKIFDPFFTTKFTGRGLGLAAVLGIVRAHKGAIKVYTQPGKGSTFKVLLPAMDGAGAPAAAPKPPAVDGRGRRVLVVDDEEDVRVFARKVLEMAGFRVTLAADGLAGVEAFAADPDGFAAVLLDLTMPRMGGADAYREMRRIRAGVRVVLTSGFAEQEAMSEFQGKGLVGFVRKPFRADEILNAVLEAVGR